MLLRLRVADPSAVAQARTASPVLEFTFGFALAHNRELVYFRVQDHLRRMGLAREGQKQLGRKGYTRISPAAKSDSAETLQRFRLLLNSVLRELPEVSRSARTGA
jgi:hypothetical protein